jgi:hypothetical protein
VPRWRSTASKRSPALVVRLTIRNQDSAICSQRLITRVLGGVGHPLAFLGIRPELVHFVHDVSYSREVKSTAGLWFPKIQARACRWRSGESPSHAITARIFPISRLCRPIASSRSTGNDKRNNQNM